MSVLVKALLQSGWSPHRNAHQFAVASTKEVKDWDGIDAHPAALAAIRRFGDLQIDFNRRTVLIDPREAAGNTDWFEELERSLGVTAPYPFGVADSHHLMLFVDNSGKLLSQHDVIGETVLEGLFRLGAE